MDINTKIIIWKSQAGLPSESGKWERQRVETSVFHAIFIKLLDSLYVCTGTFDKSKN